MSTRAEPPALQLALHAYPALLIAGRAAPLKLRHALALLAFLSQAQGPVGRSHLAALLWPDGEPALVRGRLRRLVRQAHAALGVTVFEGDTDALWLRAGCRSDRHDTQQAMAAAEALASPGAGAAGTPPTPGVDTLAQLERLAAPLLAPQAAGWLDGFSLGTEAFDAWVDATRAVHAFAGGDAVKAVRLLRPLRRHAQRDVSDLTLIAAAEKEAALARALRHERAARMEEVQSGAAGARPGAAAQSL